MNRKQTDFFTLGDFVIDDFADGIGDRTHGDDDIGGVLGSVIAERFVASSGDFADLVHVFFDNIGDRQIVFLLDFLGLEINIVVLGRALCIRGRGVQRTVAECLDGLAVKQSVEHGIIHDFDLVDFMTRAESVEEMHERNACLDGGQMGDTG